MLGMTSNLCNVLLVYLDGWRIWCEEIIELIGASLSCQLLNGFPKIIRFIEHFDVPITIEVRIVYQCRIVQNDS